MPALPALRPAQLLRAGCQRSAGVARCAPSPQSQIVHDPSLHDAEPATATAASAAVPPAPLSSAADLPPFADSSQGSIQQVDQQSAHYDFMGESTEGNLQLVRRLRRQGVINVLGLSSLDDAYGIDYSKLQGARLCLECPAWVACAASALDLR